MILTLLLLVAVVAASRTVIMMSTSADTEYDRSLLRSIGDPEAEAPDIRAKSAVMYSLDLDRPVYEKDPGERLAPYSITKILTCYLALENLDPDQMVTASKNACEYLEEGMLMELVPGEQVRAIDLVYACMMMSANDGATALAEAVSGDVASFAKLMNDTAASWGCTDTNFVNANGWDNKKHYTSAHDMEIITRKCLENDTLRKISMTKYYTVPATNKGEALFMENALLKTMDDMRVLTGGKTGSWSETQCSIALEFREKGLSGVIVLLDDTLRGRAEDVRKLIAYSHEVIPGFLVTRNGEKVCEANVKHGAQRTVALTADRKGYAYPASGKADDVKVKTSVRELKAPVKKGAVGGYYFVYANDKLAYKGKLLTAEAVDESRLTKQLKKFGIR